MLCFQVYFDELTRHSDMDTLALTQSTSGADHVTPAAAGTRPHQSSRCSTPPEAAASPTDLSMRRDRSTTTDFTSPSSGFDSPSMHAAAGVAAVDGTAARNGCSDSSAAAEADRSESYVTSPSPRRAVSCAPVTDPQRVSAASHSALCSR